MKAQFLTDLVMRDDCARTGRICFTLMEPLQFWSVLLGRLVIVEAGKQTDLLSIPWLLKWLFPPVGQYDYGAVVHDDLYSKGDVTRKQADDVLFEAMSCAYRPNWKRYAIWVGVRVGGWWVWNHYRRAQAARA